MAHARTADEWALGAFAAYGPPTSAALLALGTFGLAAPAVAAGGAVATAACADGDCGNEAGAAASVAQLTAEDLGIKGSLQELRGTFSLNEGVATVRIDMIRGEITNPFQVVQNLSETARAAGATTLRIEGTLANERLYTVLVRRYAMRTEGGVDCIEIPLQ
jgi:hypothetical protein